MFDPKISINRIFWKEPLEVVSGQCEHCIILRIHIVSQFLDESSNLKAGCKENTFYDALDAIYVSCIHNSNSKFFTLVQ